MTKWVRVDRGKVIPVHLKVNYIDQTFQNVCIPINFHHLMLGGSFKKLFKSEYPAAIQTLLLKQQTRKNNLFVFTRPAIQFKLS